MSHPRSRGTINLEEAPVLVHEAHGGRQYRLRLHAPATAAAARAGQFIHLLCDPSLPMRRPMSIMRAGADQGWIDILYKAHGLGTALLSGRRPGEAMSLLGPIGVPFKQSGYRPRPLLLGGGLGIPPLIFLAEHLKSSRAPLAPLVLMGSEAPFPFPVRPSGILVDGVPDGVIAGLPLLEDWGIPARLCSTRGYPGCHNGLVTDLAAHWLRQLAATERKKVEIFACGPPPMLRAVARLAAAFDLPCQISLEEYMACAVGGCAGCAAPLRTARGMAMKRVCVDGPVFEAAEVFPQETGRHRDGP